MVGGLTAFGNRALTLTLWKKTPSTYIFSESLIVIEYKLPKFDVIDADIPFCKRGHNLETEAKLDKAQHPFWNEVSLNVGADFQLILSKDARKRTWNAHPCMQFYFIEKKTKSVSWDFYD